MSLLFPVIVMYLLSVTTIMLFCDFQKTQVDVGIAHSLNSNRFLANWRRIRLMAMGKRTTLILIFDKFERPLSVICHCYYNLVLVTDPLSLLQNKTFGYLLSLFFMSLLLLIIIFIDR